MLRQLCILLFTFSVAHGQFGDHGCVGGRDVIVHLFEWKWSDIQAECPKLAASGYCAVQVSPPQEHVVFDSTSANPYPWWQRFQPVSYIVTSRSGDETAFQNMVTACNAAGVQIYVDAVINHMTGDGSGIGSAGSAWDGGDELGQSYPGVPYDETHFNGRDVCSTPDLVIGDPTDVNQVRDCRLYGLRDLSLDDTYVQTQVTGYIQKLVDWGVAGFRVDASKHMWPEDLTAIFGAVSPPPYLYLQVIGVAGEPIQPPDYTGLGKVTEFAYGLQLSDVVLKENGTKLADLHDFGEAWGFIPSSDAIVFIDNQDNQRGHEGAGDVLTFKDHREYVVANVFMLGWNYGFPRVMSSYNFTDTEAGPPSDSSGNTNDVVCFDGDWICEHAWPPIKNMINFHNQVLGEPVANWWDNGQDAIAFSRGSKGFVVINNEDAPISQNFQTGLPAGEYCDVISCDGNIPPCAGPTCRGSITVDDLGFATIDVVNDEHPERAYHV